MIKFKKGWLKECVKSAEKELSTWTDSRLRMARFPEEFIKDLRKKYPNPKINDLGY